MSHIFEFLAYTARLLHSGNKTVLKGCQTCQRQRDEEWAREWAAAKMKLARQDSVVGSLSGAMPPLCKFVLAMLDAGHRCCGAHAAAACNVCKVSQLTCCKEQHKQRTARSMEGHKAALQSHMHTHAKTNKK
jgi:hypothetical protein